jgi:hypothetical protein
LLGAGWRCCGSHVPQQLRPLLLPGMKVLLHQAWCWLDRPEPEQLGWKHKF